MKRLAISWRVLPVALLALPCAFGYIGETLTTSGGQTIQVTRPDFANLQFYLNSLVVAGATSSLVGAQSPVITASSNPTAAVEAAMAGWNSAGSAGIHFNALLPTTSGHNSADCTNVISLAAASGDLSVLGFVSAASPGAIEITVNAIATTAGSACGGPVVAVGGIYDSDVLLNPYIKFSTDGSANTVDVQGVMAHEFGHALGMNHSGLLGATMYPYFGNQQLYQRHVSWDEKAFAATYYPSGTKTLGTISGTVTMGSSPVAYGLVTLIDFSGGQKTVGSLTSATGTFSVQVPPGSYGVYAEPFNTFVGPYNIYSLTTGTIGQGTTLPTTAFQPTFSGGNVTPVAQYVVTAGSTSTANISVTSGASPLAAPYYGVGKAGANGDVSTYLAGGAVPVTAGQSFDIAFSGAGIDTTITVDFIGTNITLVGSPRMDSSGETVNGQPIIRQTLQVGSSTNATMGTLWIIKGTNIVPFSGVLDVEPMVPTVNGVFDAESARAGLTSGQWGAVYGNNLANGTGSWNGNIDFTGGVAAGDPLPSVLGGVRVTVNSIPASVYYVCGTCSPNQINFLTPSGLPTTGTLNVVVSNFGTASAAFSVPAVQASPSFFYYTGGGNIYPVAQQLSDGVLVGDPTVVAGTERAHPGQTIIMYCNGLAAATGGIIVPAPLTPLTQNVTVTAGSIPLTATGAYLIQAGLFQVNVTLPTTIAAGTYTLTMTVPGGSTSTSGLTVVLPVGP